MNGGTTITVYGEYFDPNADDVEVLVGGMFVRLIILKYTCMNKL